MKIIITFPLSSTLHTRQQHRSSAYNALTHPIPWHPRPALTDRDPGSLQECVSVCVWIKATVAPVRSSGV